MEKSQPYFIVQMFFILGKNVILGNFDTTAGKICISRPLGTTPVRGT